MVKEQMESQTLVVPHLFQCAMVYQEQMDTQVLIVLPHLFQHVEQNMEDNQELIVKLDMEVISQHQLEHQAYFKEMIKLKWFKFATDIIWINAWLEIKWNKNLKNSFNSIPDNKSQHALIDTLSTANQFAVNHKLPAALNQELQLHTH